MTVAIALQANEVLDTYTRTQNQLWNQWLESVRQLEAITPLAMGWEPSRSLQLLNGQMQSAIDTNKAWAQVWIEGLDHGNGLAIAMVTWNHQLVERHTEVRKELLDTWLSVLRTFDPFHGMGQIPTRQSVEALQDAINKTMAIPFQLTASHTREDEKPAPSAKQGSENAGIRKTA